MQNPANQRGTWKNTGNQRGEVLAEVQDPAKGRLVDRYGRSVMSVTQAIEEMWAQVRKTERQVLTFSHSSQSWYWADRSVAPQSWYTALSTADVTSVQGSLPTTTTATTDDHSTDDNYNTTIASAAAMGERPQLSQEHRYSRGTLLRLAPRNAQLVHERIILLRWRMPLGSGTQRQSLGHGFYRRSSARQAPEWRSTHDRTWRRTQDMGSADDTGGLLHDPRAQYLGHDLGHDYLY